MIANILLIILFIGLSIWLMLISITDINTPQYQFCIDIGLWVLGIYLGIGICSLMKFI